MKQFVFACNYVTAGNKPATILLPRILKWGTLKQMQVVQRLSDIWTINTKSFFHTYSNFPLVPLVNPGAEEKSSVEHKIKTPKLIQSYKALLHTSHYTKFFSEKYSSSEWAHASCCSKRISTQGVKNMLHSLNESPSKVHQRFLKNRLYLVIIQIYIKILHGT